MNRHAKEFLCERLQKRISIDDMIEEIFKELKIDARWNITHLHILFFYFIIVLTVFFW